MHLIRFRKRQGFAHKPGQPLPQGVVESLDVIGLPTAFRDGMMGQGIEYLGIGVPEIAVRVAPFVGRRNALPQLPATAFAPVTDKKGDHLSGAATQRQPHPPLLAFTEHT